MKTLLYLCIITLFYACEPKPVYKYIDENTKMKFHKGDTLDFISPLRTDSFTISNFEDLYAEKDNIFSEWMDIRYHKININISKDSIFTDDTEYRIQRTKFSINLHWRNFYSGGSDTSKNTIDTTFVIGNKTIDNVFVFFNESVVLPHFPNDVKRVFYCHFYGVIAYECYSGETFVMNKNCFDKYIDKR